MLDARLWRVTPTARVEVREIRILPGAPAGLHLHNCPVVGSIVAGSVIFHIEGQPAVRLGPGEVFYEPEGADRQVRRH